MESDGLVVQVDTSEAQIFGESRVTRQVAVKDSLFRVQKQRPVVDDLSPLDVLLVQSL